jgi:hypothetical protein
MQHHQQADESNMKTMMNGMLLKKGTTTIVEQLRKWELSYTKSGLLIL